MSRRSKRTTLTILLVGCLIAVGMWVWKREPDIVPIAVLLALVELLRLVTPEDPHDVGVVGHELLDEPRPDRAGAAGHEDSPAAERRRVDARVPPARRVRPG